MDSDFLRYMDGEGSYCDESHVSSDIVSRPWVSEEKHLEKSLIDLGLSFLVGVSFSEHLLILLTIDEIQFCIIKFHTDIGIKLVGTGGLI